jgi:hypothetical protein
VDGADDHTAFTAVGRCHVEDDTPVKVVDVDFTTH